VERRFGPHGKESCRDSGNHRRRKRCPGGVAAAACAIAIGKRADNVGGLNVLCRRPDLYGGAVVRSLIQSAFICVIEIAWTAVARTTMPRRVHDRTVEVLRLTLLDLFSTLAPMIRIFVVAQHRPA